jgi:hypothetical protein
VKCCFLSHKRACTMPCSYHSCAKLTISQASSSWRNSHGGTCRWSSRRKSTVRLRTLWRRCYSTFVTSLTKTVRTFRTRHSRWTISIFQLSVLHQLRSANRVTTIISPLISRGGRRSNTTIWRRQDSHQLLGSVICRQARYKSY